MKIPDYVLILAAAVVLLVVVRKSTSTEAAKQATASATDVYNPAGYMSL